MDLMASKLCDIQGRLFELSVKKGCDSEQFVSFFMRSNTARYLDSRYNRMQWAGEEYLLEEVLEEAGDKISKTETPYDIDVMYWIGYIYRYWHYYQG